MKLERSSTISLAVVSLAVLSLLASGCQKKTVKIEEPVTSEAVIEAPPVEEVVEAPPVEEVEETVEEVIEEAEEMVATEDVITSHVVEKGEHLWGISESSEIYADPFQWPLIYKANRDQIKDPDLIYPEQVFEIPRDSSMDEIDAAIHEAKTRGPWSLWDGK